MNILQAFLGEHAIFYAQFSHLEQHLADIQDVAAIHAQGKMLAAALATHANLENELLFASIESHLGPIGPLTVMRMDHEQIENLLDELPHLDQVTAARHTLSQTIAIARQHFAKEEQVLYPLAAQHLPATLLEQLGAVWGERRQVTLAIPND